MKSNKKGLLPMLLTFFVIIFIISLVLLLQPYYKETSMKINESESKHAFSEIRGYEIRNLIDSKTDYLILIDREYRLYDIQDINNSLSKLQFKTYQSEIYDCDDFTFESMSQLKKEFPGMAVGYISVTDIRESETFRSLDELNANFEAFNKSLGYQNIEIERWQNYGKWYYKVIIAHAVNIIIDSDLNVWYFDPQNQKLIKFDERPLKEVQFIML